MNINNSTSLWFLSRDPHISDQTFQITEQYAHIRALHSYTFLTFQVFFFFIVPGLSQSYGVAGIADGLIPHAALFVVLSSLQVITLKCYAYLAIIYKIVEDHFVYM